MTSPGLVGLDPVLMDFWSAFPCPPPWNEDLLFRLNFTSCVSAAVGERLVGYLADRCHVTLPPGGLGGRGGAGATGYERGVHEGGVACDTSCKILISIFVSLFVVGVIVGVGVWIWRRRRWRGKEMRGGGQEEPRARTRGGGGGGERGRRNHYAGIHYASASVVSPDRERPRCQLPRVDDPLLPQQLHSYIYNPRDNNDDDDAKLAGDFRGHPHLHHHHHHHLQLCPLRRRAAYSAVDQRHSTGFVQDNEDLPHHYDYIADLDSLRFPSGGDPEGEEHEYTYCTCPHDCPENVSAENGYRLLQQFNFPRGQSLEGYPQDFEDHTRQHEISKPFPRYPEDSSRFRYPGEVSRRGPLPYENVLGDVMDNASEALVTFSGGVPLQDGRTSMNFSTTAASGIHPGYLPDARTHPGYLPHSRNHPIQLVDSRHHHPSYLADGGPHPSYLEDTRSHAEAFNNLSRSQHDSSQAGSRHQLPTISSNLPGTLERPPAGNTSTTLHSGHRVGPVPRPYRDPWGQEDSSHYNSLRTSSLSQAGSNVYEDYPQSPGKEMVPRGKSLALQPQFYMDLLQGGGTSTV